jgi:acyl phosphate:glycerol-3-phosphate acyltransferase
MYLWLCPLIAFLCGSIPFGWIFGKCKGIDIRQHGSGNIGATNVWRVLGKSCGIPCFLLDVLKGLVPTIIGISLLRYTGMKNPAMLAAFDSQAEMHPMLTAQIAQVITGLCAILGHNYSPWVNFKGGKGIATSAGVLIALMPAAVLILVIIWSLVFYFSRYVSLASIIAAAALPFLSLLGSFVHGKIADGTWNKPLLAFSLLIAVLAIGKHRSNIQRLRLGTENRFSKKS